MGLFDKLFRRPPTTAKPAPSLNGNMPTFGQFGTDIYASDVVQQCLACIVGEMKKLNPTHVRGKGQDPAPVAESSVQAVLNEPNPLMTTADFLEKTVWLLLLNYNVFIVPVYRVWTDKATGAERRYYEALYPINPYRVDFIEDASGSLFCHFWFRNGYDTTVPYDDIIHIRQNYSVNQYMGGGYDGQPDQRGILNTLELNAQMLKGIAKAMNAGMAINGLIKYNTLMDDGKMAAAVQELENKLNANQSGFLPVDLKCEFVPFERKTSLVDADTLKFLDEKLTRNWGVPLAILTGDYTKEQYEAFYQKTLEPLIVSISQAFTKKLFTEREKQFGNRVNLYPKDLIFMTVSQTLEMINILAPTGAMYENEKRAALGLRPLPELEGKRFMSLNWIDANNADQYQVGLENAKPNVDVVAETKDETITEE